jgi:hypothetical protein
MSTVKYSNIDKPERSKIWKTRFVNCESVEETRARQILQAMMHDA